MALINFQPNPKIPPIGFFEPISVDPKDMMTDVEFLLGVIKKLNEIVAQTNKNTEFIEEYTGKIEEIEAEIARLRNEMTQFEQDVNNSIALQFAQIKVELQAMIATALSQANAYTDAIAGQLRQEIQAISVGDITVWGVLSGIAHAGCKGNINARIRALKMKLDRKAYHFIDRLLKPYYLLKKN